MINLAPDNSAGYQVRMSHRGFDRLLNMRLLPYGVKAGYWYYLRALWIEDGVTQTALSRKVNVAESTTVTMVNGMIKDGLIVRAQDKDDKRKRCITLTKKGKALENKLMKHAVDINQIATSGISPKDIATCLTVLQQFTINIQAALDENKNMLRKKS